MRHLTLNDIIEKLVKHRYIDKQSLILVEHRYQNTIQSLIELCLDQGILRESDERLVLLKPVELLVLLPNFGIAPDRYNLYIQWHEFEDYIARMLTELGWDVYRGYTHTKVEKFQVDIIALNDVLKLSMLIECKHWKRMSRICTNLDFIVNTHIKRVEKFLRNCEWVCSKINKLRGVKNILPVVVVLYDLPIKVLDGVPIVPIHKMLDFVVNVDVYIDSLNLTLYVNRCYHEVPSALQ